MFKTTPHISIEDQDWNDTIHSIVWGSIFVLGMLAILIYGLAWTSSVTVTSEDIYARRRMENRVEQLEEKVIGLNVLWAEMYKLHDNHVHRYSDGKVK